jgi:hypothetical protein
MESKWRWEESERKGVRAARGPMIDEGRGQDRIGQDRRREERRGEAFLFAALWHSVATFPSTHTHTRSVVSVCRMGGGG